MFSEADANNLVWRRAIIRICDLNLKKRSTTIANAKLYAMAVGVYNTHSLVFTKLHNSQTIQAMAMLYACYQTRENKKWQSRGTPCYEMEYELKISKVKGSV